MTGPHACLSPYWNFPPTGKDKLAGAAPTEGSGTPTPTLVMSRAPTSAPATTAAIAPSLANELFKQFMKAYLEAQVPGRTKVDAEPRKQPFRAKFLKLSYGNLHMDCYRFCRQSV